MLIQKWDPLFVNMEFSNMLSRQTRILTFAASLFAVLSACGGSSSQFSGANDASISQFQYLVSQEADLSARVLSDDFSSSEALMSVGRASYGGTIFGRFNDGSEEVTELFGEMTILVDLLDHSQGLSGYADGFVTTDGSSASGRLNLSNTLVDVMGDPHNDYTISGDLLGHLEFPGSEMLDISLRIEGDFYGTTAHLVAGGVQGVVTTNSEISQFVGRFVTEFEQPE